MQCRKSTIFKEKSVKAIGWRFVRLFSHFFLQTLPVIIAKDGNEYIGFVYKFTHCVHLTQSLIGGINNLKLTFKRKEYRLN